MAARRQEERYKDEVPVIFMERPCDLLVSKESKRKMKAQNLPQIPKGKRQRYQERLRKTLVTYTQDPIIPGRA